MTLASSPHH